MEISRDVARRFLALHHLLAPPRSLPAEHSSVMRVFDRLGSLQFDPIDVAGRNHDLVLLARIAGYRREWTDALLYEQRTLFEAFNKSYNLSPSGTIERAEIITEFRRSVLAWFESPSPCAANTRSICFLSAAATLAMIRF